MTPESPAFLFRSDLFRIDPGEDAETNPYCYGRSLAEWVRSKFIQLGYNVEPIIAEDWGWCVMLTRKPFMLWIACGNDRSAFYDRVAPESKSAFVPNGREVVWSCLVGTDVPIWSGFFWKRLLGRESTQQRVHVAVDQLRGMLSNEPRVALTDQGAA